MILYRDAHRIRLTARLVHDYLERMASLITDGYILNHATNQEWLLLARLSHSPSGNTIILSANLQTLALTQKTNNLLTFIKVYGD